MGAWAAQCVLGRLGPFSIAWGTPIGYGRFVLTPFRPIVPTRNTYKIGEL